MSTDPTLTCGVCGATYPHSREGEHAHHVVAFQEGFDEGYAVGFTDALEPPVETTS